MLDVHSQLLGEGGSGERFESGIYRERKYLRTCLLRSDDGSPLFACCESHGKNTAFENESLQRRTISDRHLIYAGGEDESGKTHKQTDRRTEAGLGATAADSLHLLVNILLQLKLWLVRLLHLPVLQFPERRGGRHQFPF